MTMLEPLSHALAALLAAAHTALTSLGVDPDVGTTWLLCIAVIVVAVRAALLPLVAHGVRLAHASARARPHLQDLAKRYQHRKDPENGRRFTAERRRIAAEHGMPRLGCCRCCCNCRSGSRSTSCWPMSPPVFPSAR